jgi:hypothetical protein
MKISHLLSGWGRGVSMELGTGGQFDSSRPKTSTVESALDPYPYATLYGVMLAVGSLVMG